MILAGSVVTVNLPEEEEPFEAILVNDMPESGWPNVTVRVRETGEEVTNVTREEVSYDPETTFFDPLRVETWFERDRSHIALYDALDELIYELWDEEVEEAFEGGFLDRRPAYLDESMITLAEERGFLTATRIPDEEVDEEGGDIFEGEP